MSLMPLEKMQAIIEAALMVAGHPLTVAALQNLFPEDGRPSSTEIKTLLSSLKTRRQEENSGIELHEVASGYRYQAKAELSPWLAKLWEERAPRYSRAFLETLVLIAYKQPITRGEIEEIRGVTVSSNIMKTLQEREWIRVIGYREVPGKPAIYGTTKEFLDYFNLKSLVDLPSLAEFKDLAVQDEKLQVQLALENSELGPENSENIPEERDALVAENNAISNVISIEEQTSAAAETSEISKVSEISETPEISEASEPSQIQAIEISEESSESLETLESLEALEKLEVG
jgi:segregation and condensation protein B